MAIKSCRVTCTDANGVQHSVDVTAGTLYEAVAQAVRLVHDLARKLMRYIRQHNKTAAPIKWAYRDFSRRISTTFHSAVTGH
jgi:hypothetical protein